MKEKEWNGRTMQVSGMNNQNKVLLQMYMATLDKNSSMK